MRGGGLSDVAARRAAGAPKVLVIVGPTAVGKTALAIRLGRAFDGEVISADSRQIYRYLDIGTGKPSPEERAALPHHLIDLVDPDQVLTLAHYRRLAAQTIEEVWSRGRLPMLVGGTGLYVRAVVEGWTVPEVAPDPSLRQSLLEEAERRGPRALHGSLAKVDPVAAQRIDPRNVRRVIRALEVYRQTGTPISRLQGRRSPGYNLLQIGLTMPRPALYRRIDDRIDRMMEEGLEEEVRWLVSQGYDYDLPSMSGLGYREIGWHLRGQLSLEEAVALIKRNTRRFVRKQYNWFRLTDKTIVWFDQASPGETLPEELVRAFVRDG